MAGRISNSWHLVKASANVLMLDKELMIFPVLSGVSTVLVSATFFAPAFFLGWVETGGGGDMSYLAAVFAFLFYLAQYTVVFFFNSALVGAALIRLDGGDPTVSDGLSLAVSRMGTIVGYAAIAATVGMVLRFLSERAGFLGRMVVGFVGVGWNLATYLAVPVLVNSGLGPVDAVKESARLFRKTWGEQVVGNFGMGWAIFLMGLSWTLVSAVVVFAAGAVSPAALFPAVGVALLGYLGLAVFSAALKGVYTAALYRYAVKGDPGYFDDGLVRHAFVARR